MSDFIKDLFDRYGVPLERDDTWQVQSARVVKHKALERLAAGAGIWFSAPQILRAERDEAVILVTGQLGDKTEWSIGEALVNANYRVSGRQAAYVYAMAEKRAKDRVILKLAGLHGVYSEEEADDFKQKPAGAANDPAEAFADFVGGLVDEAEEAAKRGMEPLRAFWNRLTPDEKTFIGGAEMLTHWKEIAAKADKAAA